MDGVVRVRVALLGAFRVSRGDDVLAVPGARLQGLLVRLALAGGRTVERGVLVDAIWGEEPPSSPGSALQTLVSRLRRVLSAGLVVQDGGGYRLGAADVDALRFERLAATGRERLRAGDPEAAAAALAEAVALWGDRPGAEPPVIAAVAPAVATRLAHLSTEAFADLAEAELSLGRPDTAAGRLTGVLAEQPVHERAAALLMDALAAQGRQAEALTVYERTRRTLADLLGADPGTALRSRHLTLLHPTPPPHPADPAMMGQHPTALARTGAASGWDRTAPARTGAGSGRDADAPARIGSRPGWDTGASARTGAGSGWDADASGEGAGVGFGYLPASLTSFVGRDGDLDRVGGLLASGRLVTVVGPGGAGKTRLALEAARRHRHEYRDGAWLVDLASVTEPAKVAAAVLAGAGLRGGAMLDARRRAEGDELDVLAGEFGGRESLLLIDNCEHLIDAVAHLVSALLPRCPRLRVLATSREPLAVDGEALVPLAPLALPGPDDTVEQAGKAASVRLFAERAAAVRPGFEVDETTLPDVVRVVRGLDGLPLALELAAARLRTLALPDLADGLSDRFRMLTSGSRTAPARHRTLRAVIAWSWDLLGEHERTLAERVSILPGGVTAASASAVCAGTAVPAAEIPELLAALVDRSLLQLAPGPGRHRMLETIREYGTDRLTADGDLRAGHLPGDGDLRADHLAAGGDLRAARDLAAAHFTELMTSQDARLRGPGQLAAMEIMGFEYDNALAALRHLCATGDSAGAIALVLALTWYWQMSGRLSDAAYWLGEALAVPGGAPTAERDCARAVYLLTRADLQPGAAADDRTETRGLAHRLLAHPELPGHHRVFGPVLLFLQRERTALAIFQRLAGGDDVWLAGLAHMFQAEIAENAGELDRVRVHVESALTRFRQAGDRWAEAATLPMRARLRRYDDLDGALSDLREARTLAGAFGSPSLVDQLHADLRWIDVHLRRGDTGRAAAAIDAARERAAHASSPEMPALLDAQEAVLRVRLGDLDRAAHALAAAERALRAASGHASAASGQARTGVGAASGHARAVVGAASGQARAVVGGARVVVRLAVGDVRGAGEALREAYAAAVDTGELPVLSLVAVNAAALAGARGRPEESAVLLGAAARLRGAHDRTDPQVRELTRRGRAALGEDGFAAAYARGWNLDARTAAALLP